MSCAPVLVLPQPRPARISQMKKSSSGASCLSLAVLSHLVRSWNAAVSALSFNLVKQFHSFSEGCFFCAENPFWIGHRHLCVRHRGSDWTSPLLPSSEGMVCGFICGVCAANEDHRDTLQTDQFALCEGQHTHTSLTREDHQAKFQASL